MNGQPVKLNAIVPNNTIASKFVNGVAIGITDADLKITIRRLSDDQFYTGVGIIFNAVPTLLSMAEVSEANVPGWWKFPFNTNTMVKDTYLTTVTDAAAKARNMPQYSEYEVGGWVQELLDSVATVDTVVDGIDTQLDTVEGKVDVIATVVDDTNTKVTATQVTVGTIDTQLDTVESKVDIVDINLDSVKLTVEDTNTDLIIVDSNLNSVKVTVESTNTGLAVVDDKIDVVDGVVDDTNTKVTATQVTVGAIDTQLDSVESKVDIIDTNLDSVKVTVDSMEGDITSLILSTARILGLQKDNFVLIGTGYDVNRIMTSGELRVYDSAANANLNDGITGLIFKYDMQSITNDGKINQYTQTRIL